MTTCKHCGKEIFKHQSGEWAHADGGFYSCFLRAQNSPFAAPSTEPAAKENGGGEEIKPCPFCGSAGMLHKSSIGYSIVCQNTESTPCDIGNTHHDWKKEAAIEMWNKRATDAELDQLRAKLAEMEAQCGVMRDQLIRMHGETGIPAFDQQISRIIAEPDAGRKLLERLETAKTALKSIGGLGWAESHTLKPEYRASLIAQTALEKLDSK